MTSQSVLSDIWTPCSKLNTNSAMLTEVNVSHLWMKILTASFANMLSKLHWPAANVTGSFANYVSISGISERRSVLTADKNLICDASPAFYRSNSTKLNLSAMTKVAELLLLWMKQRSISRPAIAKLKLNAKHVGYILSSVGTSLWSQTWDSICSWSVPGDKVVSALSARRFWQASKFKVISVSVWLRRSSQATSRRWRRLCGTSSRRRS